MSSFAAFEHKIAGVQRELSGQAGRERLRRVAEATAKDVADAVRADLGDTSMSGWRRGAPIEVEGRVVMKESAALVLPTRPSAGPMRVLESGRHQGNAGGFAGPGINTVTGLTARNKNGSVRKVRARKARRWNGYTSGKGTWSDFTEKAEREVPKRYEREVVKALGKHLGV